MEEKKVHFSEKRVDETWKENVSKEKKPGNPQTPETQAISFAEFVTSLGLQALMRMGELKAPGGKEIETDLEAAQETIDLLLMLKEKTKSNVTPEEESILKSLIPELQMKFVQHKTAKS